MCEIPEGASIGVYSVFLAVVLGVAVVRWIMDKILIKYQGNGSSRHHEEYFESTSKLRREKTSEDPFTCQLERPTIPWEARNRSIHFVLTYSCPHSLLGYLKPFCNKDLRHHLAGNPPLKEDLHNLLLAVR